MSKVKSANLANALKNTLEEYGRVATDDMKQAVVETGKEVKTEISKRAPRRTGAYKKSWAVKKSREDATSISLTVHSRNKYQLTHLLEHGHAKRGGGRTRAYPHIEPAQSAGEKILMDKIMRGLGNG